MKPNNDANYILKTTRSLAKMVEYNVPAEERNLNAAPPEKLFTLVIGILGDLSKQIIDSFNKRHEISFSEEDARFCAIFFDSYKNTQRLRELDNYSLLVGAVAYYFANLPGSALVLLSAIDKPSFNLQAQNIDDALYWIMNGNYTSIEEFNESFYYLELTSITTEIKKYFQTGFDDGKKKLFDDCVKLQKKVHSEGTPRELFLGDFIYAITILKVKNSAWKNLPLFSRLSMETWAPAIKKRGFIKELWPAQIELGREGAFSGQSLVVQMPTSAGKTKSTELIIRSAFLSQRTNIAVVVAPFNALCHEIKNDFYKCFRGEGDISIDEINDALISNDSCLLSQHGNHIIILTPEKLYYLLTQQNDFVANIGLIIFDEGHQFDDSKRGPTYELLLTELKELLKPEAQIVLISAVIPNASEIAHWLGEGCKSVHGSIKLPTQRSMAYIENRSLCFFENENIFNREFYAPKIIEVKELPLKKGERKVRLFPDYTDSKSLAFYLALNQSQHNCVAVFLGTKIIVGAFLKKIEDFYLRAPDEIKPRCDHNEQNKIKYIVKQNFGENNTLFKCICNGVFPHHGNIPQSIRLCIENAAHESLINFIVCTSTLAQGVNLPIKYLFISSLWQGKEKVKVRDFHNLIGRVARSGKLTEGSVIFADAEISNDLYRQSEINKIINPDNSERCKSVLLKLFDDVLSFYSKSQKKKHNYPMDVAKWLKMYFSQRSSSEFASAICSELNDQDYYLKEDIKDAIDVSFRCIENIENFLFNYGDSLKDLDIVQLATSTFVYETIEYSKKEQVIFLFEQIRNKLLSIDDIRGKLKIFSHTLMGLNKSLFLNKIVTEKKDLLIEAKSCKEFVSILFDLFFAIYTENNFINYSNKEKLLDAVHCWINGNSYQYLFNLLKDGKIGPYKMTYEYCVDIFDGCFSYDGSVLVNSITELLLAESPNNELQEKLQWYQKQIKYGLPDKESIIIYEIGFCDRTLAQKIAPLFKGIEQKKEMISHLILEDSNVRTILANYPSYFEKCVYDRLSYQNK